MEVLKKMVKAGDALVKVGEDVMADGKLDWTDLAKAPEALPHIQALYEVFKERDQLIEDLKEFGDDKLEELKA